MGGRFSSQTRKCVPYGTRFRVWLHSFPPMCPFGPVGLLHSTRPARHEHTPHVGRVFVSTCIPSHPTRPARHEHASHMGRVFMSGYILSPPEHHQRAHFGTLAVFRLVLLQADTKPRPMSGGFSCLLLPSALSPPATPSTQRPRHAIWVCFGL